LLPQESKHYNDAIDFITEACNDIVVVTLEDGRKQKQLQINPKKAWWKSLLLNTQNASRFALELEEWERLASLCSRFMSKIKAEDFSTQISEIGLSFRYSLDAKSSESQRNKNNAQATLLDKILRNKQERIVSLKGDAKRSLFDAFVGKEKERQVEEE